MDRVFNLNMGVRFMIMIGGYAEAAKSFLKERCE